MKVRLRPGLTMMPILSLPNRASLSSGIMVAGKDYEVLESRDNYYRIDSGWISANDVKITDNVQEYNPINIPNAQEAIQAGKSFSETYTPNTHNARIHNVELDEGIKDAIRSHGYYFKEDLDKFNTFKRFSVLDPYDKIHMAREYLFFTKPDMNIFQSANGGSLTEGLANDPFFRDLSEINPNVLYQLQRSVSVQRSPFMNRLSWAVKNTLDMPSITLDDIETASNQYGTRLYYSTHSVKSNDNHDFSLEFSDGKSLSTYLIFRAWERYNTLKSLGIVSPKEIYKDNNELDNYISIYKFIVLENGMDILYYAKFTGVTPKEAPRESFSEVTEGLTHNVSFRAFDVDDLDPIILSDFNDLSTGGSDLPLFNQSIGRPDGRLPTSARVERIRTGGRIKYRLKWGI